MAEKKLSKGAVLLSQWRKETGYRILALVYDLNLRNMGVIYRWEQGINLPSVLNALALERISGDRIPVQAWGEEPTTAPTSPAPAANASRVGDAELSELLEHV